MFAVNRLIRSTLKHKISGVTVNGEVQLQKNTVVNLLALKCCKGREYFGIQKDKELILYPFRLFGNNFNIFKREVGNAISNSII